MAKLNPFLLPEYPTPPFLILKAVPCFFTNRDTLFRRSFFCESLAIPLVPVEIPGRLRGVGILGSTSGEAKSQQGYNEYDFYER